MLLKEVINGLKGSGINYQVKENNTIETRSGITFWFYNDDIPQTDFVLCKFGRFVELPIVEDSESNQIEKE